MSFIDILQHALQSSILDPSMPCKQCRINRRGTFLKEISAMSDLDEMPLYLNLITGWDTVADVKRSLQGAMNLPTKYCS